MNVSIVWHHPGVCSAVVTAHIQNCVVTKAMIFDRAERRRFRRTAYFHQHQLKKYFLLTVMSALNLASRLLPDAKHALSFLGIGKATYVMLKSAAAVALSNNRKKFEISQEERGRRIESSSVVAFRKCDCI